MRKANTELGLRRIPKPYVAAAAAVSAPQARTQKGSGTANLGLLRTESRLPLLFLREFRSGSFGQFGQRVAKLKPRIRFPVCSHQLDVTGEESSSKVSRAVTWTRVDNPDRLRP